jgi:hypothetical protein
LSGGGAESSERAEDFGGLGNFVITLFLIVGGEAKLG